MSVSDWKDLCPHTVTFYPLSSYNTYGKASHSSTGTAYRARVSYTHRRVVSAQQGSAGQEILSSHNVIILGNVALTSTNDKITLPDGTSPQIVSWNKEADENGILYTQVFFGGF
jgi:hypothetical protein